MNPLFAAAGELLASLDALGLQACLIEGLAVERWGEPRLTRDVDATVLAEYGSEARVVDAVLDRCAARHPDARGFALTHRVLLLRASNGVDVDLSLAAFDFEREALDRATPYEFEPGATLRTCSAEDLIVYKAVAGRPRDLADIETIVVRQFGRLDLGRIRRWLGFFAELTVDGRSGGPSDSRHRGKSEQSVLLAGRTIRGVSPGGSTVVHRHDGDDRGLSQACSTAFKRSDIHRARRSEAEPR